MSMLGVGLGVGVGVGTALGAIIHAVCQKLKAPSAPYGNAEPLVRQPELWLPPPPAWKQGAGGASDGWQGLDIGGDDLSSW